MPLKTNGSYAFPKSRVKILMTQPVADKIDELFAVIKEEGYKDFDARFDRGTGYDGGYPEVEYTFYHKGKRIFCLTFKRWGTDFNDIWLSDFVNNPKYGSYTTASMKIENNTELTDHSELLPVIDEIINIIKGFKKQLQEEEII